MKALMVLFFLILTSMPACAQSPSTDAWLKANKATPEEVKAAEDARPRLSDEQKLAIRERQLMQAENQIQQGQILIQLRDLQARLAQLQEQAKQLNAETTKLADDTLAKVKFPLGTTPDKWRLDPKLNVVPK